MSWSTPDFSTTGMAALSTTIERRLDLAWDELRSDVFDVFWTDAWGGVMAGNVVVGTYTRIKTSSSSNSFDKSALIIVAFQSNH